jgi:hypothetical protein
MHVPFQFGWPQILSARSLVLLACGFVSQQVLVFLAQAGF